jgi:hypothetical protein
VRATLAAPAGLELHADQQHSRRPDGLTDVLVELDSLGRANVNLRYQPAPVPPEESPVVPPFEPAAGVLAVAEEQLHSAHAVDALLRQARSGRVVVVFPPALPPPAAPAGAFVPWTETVTPPCRLTADSGTPAAALLQALGLPADQTTGVRLNTIGVPRPLLRPDALALGRHVALPVGAGLLIRLGRLTSAELEAALQALTADGAQQRLLGPLTEVRRLLATAREHISLDGEWAFLKDPRSEGRAAEYADPGHDATDWQRIRVPATWEAGGHPGYDGVAWYRREQLLPESWSGLDLVLELDGADDEDVSFFNGQQVGQSRGWNRPHRYRIPARLVRANGPQLVVIRVTDHAAGGGLYRPVRLRPEPAGLLRKLEGDGMLRWLEWDGPDPVAPATPAGARGASL